MRGSLTPAEWAVMSALWGREPQTLSEVIRTMRGKMEWNYRTYATYLNKLCEKGFVSFEARGRDKFYYAIVPKEACIHEESRSIMSKMDEAAAKDLLVCMIREGGLSRHDRDELRDLLNTLAAEND